MKSNERFPWLDKNGDPLSVEELKEVSKDWSTKIWNQYAETLEVPQTEFMTKYYDWILDNFEKNPDDLSSDEADDDLPDYSDLKVAFAALPTIDQVILEASVVDQLSEAEIARKFRISRREVMDSKRRSVSVLGKRLRQNPSVMDAASHQSHISPSCERSP